MFVQYTKTMPPRKGRARASEGESHENAKETVGVLLTGL